MAERSRYLTFAGTNLKNEYGLIYSSFEETLPAPKTTYVSVPAGLDIDLSEAVGALGWKNGKHVIKFLLYGETQAERLAKKRDLISLVHGVRSSYKLSWDSAYTYTGRATVSVEHYTEQADLVTIEIDRVPWKVSGYETIEVDCTPTGVASLVGSKRYRTVTVELRTDAKVKVGSGQVQNLSAGTYTLASELTSDTDITITIDAVTWVLEVEGTNLVTNPDITTTSGTDVSLDADYTINGTDIVFTNANTNQAIVRYRRVDL